MMKKILFPLLALTLMSFMVSVSHAEDQAALEEKLAYLKDLPEISWVKFLGNDVIIGFNEHPKDLRSIINAAALHGNKAYGFGVHVWAVDAKYTNWDVWQDSAICTATARYGKIEKNTCR